MSVPFAWHSTALHSSTAHQYDSKRLVVTAMRTVAVSVTYLARVRVRVRVRLRLRVLGLGLGLRLGC